MGNGVSLIRDLRFALKHLYDANSLRQSGLIDLLALRGEADPAAKLVLTLRDSIQEMQPESCVPADAPAWRVYDVLQYRFLEHATQQEVAAQLGIGVRHVRREERRAILALAAHIAQTRLGRDLQAAGQENAAAGPPELLLPVTNDNLAYLLAKSGEQYLDIVSLIGDVLLLIAPLARKHATRLTFRPQEQAILVECKRVILRQALLSLLSAVVSGALGGEVVIGILEDQGRVRVSVNNCTAGPEESGRLEQAETLRLARQLLDALNGTLQVRHCHGAIEIWVSLPLVAQRQVLVIDDHPDTIRLIERYAEGTPYHVISVPEPMRAIEVAVQRQPTLIVLDVMMPSIDGWETLARLHTLPDTARIPVLVCTVLPHEELAQSLGADAFLQKPFSRDELLAVWEDLARRSVHQAYDSEPAPD